MVSKNDITGDSIKSKSNSEEYRNNYDMIFRDWRGTSYYRVRKPCCICGSTNKIGIDPRFGYAVCEEHSKLSPIEINKQEKLNDGKPTDND